MTEEDSLGGLVRLEQNLDGGLEIVSSFVGCGGETGDIAYDGVEEPVVDAGVDRWPTVDP